MANPEDTNVSTKPSFLRGRSSKNQPINTDRPRTFLTESLRPAPSTHGTLDSTKDGDTIRMADGSVVRLLGVNAPETGKAFKGTKDQPFSQEAKARLQELLQEGELTLMPGRSEQDKYNRTLAHLLTSDGRNVQEILLQEGLAKAMSIEPNTRLQALYENLEQEARDNKVGMWANPVPKKEIGEFNDTVIPEGFIPSYLRDVGSMGKAEHIAATPILEDLVNNIQDDGLTANMYNWVTDLNQPKPSEKDFVDINNSIAGIVESRGLSSQASQLILDKAKNVQHAELLADRMKRIQDRAPGREAMSFGAAALSGIGGFVADPTNLIPGTLIFKGATKLATTLPKLRSAMTKAMPTLSGKAGTYAAFAVTEEAIRTAPRLNSDPTYDFQDYLTNTVAAGAFGAGIARGIPTARWVSNKVLAPAWKGVSGAIGKSYQKMSESIQIRTALNVMQDSVKHHARSTVSKATKDTLKNADTHATVRTARNKAREQVANAKETSVIRSAVSAFKDKLNGTDLDLANPELLVDLEQGMTKILKAVDKNSKVSDSAAKFEATTGKAKAAAGELANQSKKSKPVKEKLDKGTVAKTRAKPDKTPTFQDAMQNVERTRTRALDALGDKAAPNARQAIEANALAATRALEAAAARQGVKIVRKTVSRETVHAKIKERVSTSVNSRLVARFDFINKSLNSSDQGMSDTLNAIVRVLGIKQTGTPQDALHQFILAEKSQVGLRATQAREQVTLQFQRLMDDFHAGYVGNPNDKDFVEGKKLIDDAQTELESLMDWIGMSNDKQFSDLVDLDPRFALLSNNFEEAIGKEAFKEIEKAYESAAQRWISKQFGTLTQSLSNKLFRSKVPLARHMAMNILELPAGIGGHATRHETAAILSEMNFNRIVYPLNVAWRDLMAEAAKDMGLGVVAKAKMQNFNPNTQGIQQDIARQVMKAVNASQMGKSTTQKPYIQKFIQELDKANNRLYDLQRDHGIEGITGANRMKNYLRQSWHDGKILDLIDNSSIGRTGVVELFAKSLKSRASGKLSQKEANELAETFLDLKLEAMDKPAVDSFTIRTQNLQGSMASIEDVIKRMSQKGQTESIEKILKWVNEPTGGVAGYVHKRHINLDYETTIIKNGETVSILDLLDNDVIGQVNRYGKEASGRAAISESTGGLLNGEQAINDYIFAMQQQAHDLGTHINTKDVRNVFRIMMGLPYDGQLPMDWRRARDAVSLAGMNGLGESQLAEFGLSVNRGLSGLFAMNQVASKTLGRVKQWKSIELTPEQQNNIDFLGELQESARLYEDMHIVARQNVHFDGRESQKTTSLLSKLVDKGTGGSYRPLLQYMQTRYTGYGAIRTMEEQLAMASLMQDAMKQVRKGKSFTTQKRFKDLGLDLDLLKRKLDDGTIELREDGNIQTLNMHRWSKKDSQSVGVAMQRHAGQQVQKGFAGEASALMQDPRVAMMMQFKSYPLQAAEKQMGRSMMFHDKEAGMGIAANAASSAAARVIRYYSLALAMPEDKREAYLEHKFSNDFATDTGAYMGIVGMMMNNYEMSTDLVFGNEESVGDQLPALNWADNYLQAAKAANPFDEDGITERDVGTVQRGAPLGTILFVNGLAGIIRNMMDTDSDQSFEENNNRGN